MLNVIKVFGIVQGVGFRPFVSRIAVENRISGTVANKGSFVEIFAQGSEADLSNFLTDLRRKSPARAAILKIDVKNLPDEEFFGFKIVESAREVGDAFISPDISICDDCKRELFDKNDRRYLHPFINCTNCGPRLTILENLPYDRERTSMKSFPMCKNCAEEYFSPDSRRFDAQPICCNACGPEIFIANAKNLRGHAAIRHVRAILARGGVVSIKGIGGFHISCDAKNFSAVKRLRESKNRPSKPFAVMFRDVEAVKRECFLSETQKIYLDSPQKPIILLEKRLDSQISSNVAPKINKIGAMLPYTPLHMLIFDFPDEISFPDALIMTSCNVSGAPIAIDDDDLSDFGGLFDAILTHNRKILLRADDSVVDFVENRPSIVRRSRGYAPLPIFVDLKSEKSVLAVGGELKNTFCLAKNDLIYVSPYIGDVGDLKTAEILEKSIDRMKNLLEIAPEVVVSDKNPKYHTSTLAKKISDALNVPNLKIQHHYAHILSCMAENNHFGEVIGVSFDGTGFGDDKTVWGGEFFACDTQKYERIAHISSFLQAGGEKSVREGWRIAFSMLNDAEIARELHLATDFELQAQKFLLESGLNCVKSTSAGRLFDAVAAILGICRVSTYEGEAAMCLQAFAERSNKNFDVKCASTADLFAEIVSRRLQNENICDLARFFHVGLAEIVAETCSAINLRTKIKSVALSGGVFQNSLLNSLVSAKLRLRGLKILRHEQIPANDGGICVGQAFFAMNYGKKLI